MNQPTPQPEAPRSVGEALRVAAARLRAAGIANGRFESELLLARLLDTDRGGLLGRRNEALNTCAATYAAWLGRRETREPLQHITGVQEFYGRELKVGPAVLIPRPETEGLVDALLELGLVRDSKVVDLGTGSGCIAVSLAVERPDLEVHALDVSSAALSVAASNARWHGVDGQVRFHRGDLAAPPESWRGTFEAVVSNPPYVSESEWDGLEPEVRDHDPRGALVAGPTGLECYTQLAPSASALLRAGGALVLELGYGQSDSVSRIVSCAGFVEITVRSDLVGIPRVLIARKPLTVGEAR